MFLKDKLKDNTVSWTGWYINETEIRNKFIESKIYGGASCYSKGNVDLIINDEVEKFEDSPNYTALMYYWDGKGYIKQFDNLQTVDDYNKAIFKIRLLHKADYIGHELIF